MIVLKVEVDQEACIGAGNCVASAPAVFDQRADDGVVVLLQSMPAADEYDAVRKAVRLCPTRAIHLSESTE